jgi:hypothetical protein
MTDSQDLLRNRWAELALIRAAAKRGNRVCAELQAIENEIRLCGLPGSDYMLGTAQDFRDEDEDDDLRPY